MGPPNTQNLAKALLTRQTERQRFDSADWAMTLPMNSEGEFHSSTSESRGPVPLKELDGALDTLSTLSMEGEEKVTP